MKGYSGESCAIAILNALKPGEIVSFSDLFERVKSKGAWKNETIWQHLMGLVVNLPPARRHWKTAKPFLLLREDGRYELYDPNKHPKTLE